MAIDHVNRARSSSRRHPSQWSRKAVFFIGLLRSSKLVSRSKIEQFTKTRQKQFRKQTKAHWEHSVRLFRHRRFGTRTRANSAAPSSTCVRSGLCGFEVDRHYYRFCSALLGATRTRLLATHCGTDDHYSHISFSTGRQAGRERARARFADKISGAREPKNRTPHNNRLSNPYQKTMFSGIIPAVD